MSEFLREVQGEIRERLRALHPAVAEYERLEAGLAALDGVRAPASRVTGATPPRAASAPAPESSAASRRTSSRRRSATRAPRGANRAAVLRALGERPGVGVSELAAATGVKKPVLHGLLARLVEQGEVVKEALPGGARGYALPREGAPAGTAAGTPAVAEPSVGPGPVAEAPGDDDAGAERDSPALAA